MATLLSLRTLLISTTVLSAAVILKLSAPAITDFAVSELPSIWNGVVSWLRPPYLYLVINCIIFVIVASSKLQTKYDEYSSSVKEAAYSPELTTVIKDLPPAPEYSPVLHDVDGVVLKNEAADVMPMAYHEYDGTGGSGKVEKVLEFNAYGDGHVDEPILSENDAGLIMNSSTTYVERNDVVTNSDEFVISKSSTPAPVQRQEDSLDYSVPAAEKPPTSTRFTHRKTVKSTLEGGKLGVSKQKRQDTLESTWRTITEGRAMPLTRHLRKSDTMETSHGGYTPLPQQKIMAKSETFHDHTTTSPNSSLSSRKLRKEPSPSQDELNRRVEAFIKKFNEEMRLQRQKSLNQYMEMVKRGAH